MNPENNQVAAVVFPQVFFSPLASQISAGTPCCGTLIAPARLPSRGINGPIGGWLVPGCDKLSCWLRRVGCTGWLRLGDWWLGDL